MEELEYNEELVDEQQYNRCQLGQDPMASSRQCR